MALKLYSYFRSSASYRVRAALHLKGLQFEYIPIHLVKGHQREEAYRKVNPMGHVPALDHDGRLIVESVAIVDYLEQKFPERSLFHDRTRVLQIMEIINSGIQPLQNLKVLQYVEKEFGKEQSTAWGTHWITKGMESLERMLEKTAGKFAVGDQVSAADCFLVPQCFAARRFGVKVEDFPITTRVDAAATALPEFEKAHPSKQPDFQA